ncbi:AraC family transcriptional regulator [Varunaivibrio sulfuroxidans]|uniref:AraC-like DNA-binding protein n=1 Tax=Varunaivibrio sulfuroxidans TaxID=1773489 RepID=A0A4R3J4F0_9PROT|nr:AraC family transcriptional regulator [Varunaivibrio sulfuroxidans]TCS60688.1 AraC-like DNA-binding protein [Varunaivibrio sulfuroxidans]WES30177.1 AraC family transcriptional regulator [Varunaivibrio sulfuroxidans]
MDLFDEIFSAMRVESALYGRLAASAPWGVAFVAEPEVRFGMVVRGSCWLTSAGLNRPMALTAGDCYIVAPQVAFSLRDDPKSPTCPCTQVFHDRDGDEVSFGGGGQTADIVGGCFFFDKAGAEPLLSMLPPVLRIGMDSTRAQALQSTLQLIALETAEPALGSKLVVSHLADILFVQAIRAHCLCDARVTTGWLAAYTDRRLGAAMRAVHGDIGRDWTARALADAAAMSRSVFARRFKEVVGETPLGYITRWRMYKAKCLLRQSDLPLGAIAEKVGYATDAAFSRVFARHVGKTPGRYRRQGADTCA